MSPAAVLPPPPPGYAIRMPRFEETRVLRAVGKDPSGRELWLAPEAADAWLSMQDAAEEAGIGLLLMSGFRSVEQQAQILRNKLESGLALAEILKTSAYPGHSEHHTGLAIDVGCTGHMRLTEDFAESTAFSWLLARSTGFGFRLSYPRENPHGIAYEPWHWCFVGGQDSGRSP